MKDFFKYSACFLAMAFLPIIALTLALSFERLDCYMFNVENWSRFARYMSVMWIFNSLVLIISNYSLIKSKAW